MTDPAVVTEERYYWTALDNYEPIPRRAELVCIEVYENRPSWKLINANRLNTSVSNSRNAIYLLDDGKTVEPYYVVGWDNNGEGSVLIQPFPTNPNGERRPDNGQEIDYHTWALGPRRAYHLKLHSIHYKGESYV